jgi:hypothetical protein
LPRITSNPIRALLVVVAAALASIVLASAPAHAAGPESPEYVVVKAGRVITVSGEEIERGEIVIVDGRITLVGTGLDYPASATVIEARNQVVMPGLIHACSTIGVPNFSRRGHNGRVQVDQEIRYDDIDFQPLLRNGFTTVVLKPIGSGVNGTASAYATAADEAWKRIVSRNVYLSMTFTSVPGDKQLFRETVGRARGEINKAEEARKKWDEEQAKKAEAEKKNEGEKKDAKPAEPAEFKAPEINPDLRPIVQLLRNDSDRVRAMIEVSNASGFLHLKDVLSELKSTEHFDHFLCLVRAEGEWPFVFDELAEAGKPILMTPNLAYYPQTVRIVNPAGELIRRGVTVGFFPSADHEGGYRRFLTDIGALTRYGLPRDEALKAAVLNPAKILGLDRRLGSIEVGKNANLLFLDRDPLDPTARIMRVMVRGSIAYDAEKNTK